jgi:hypothetical protein
MGIAYNPKIVTNGLVLCVDSANLKSYDKYENLVTYSQKFDEAIWNKNNCSVVQNDIVAPDGTLTAARITATVNDDVIVDNTYTATYNETPLTYSIFAKAGTYRYIAIQSYVNVWSKTLVFDLQTGNPIEPFYPNDGRTWKIVSYPNGWYRCIVTYPANYYYYYRFRFALTNYVGPSDGGIDTTNSPSVGQYIYVWGAQLEKGTTATDYYATTSSLKNRSTTILDLSGNGNNGTLINGPLYNNDNGGSLVFDGTVGKVVTVTYNSSNFVNTNFTWIAWVKGKGSPTVNMPQIGYGSGGWPRLGFFENVGTWYFQQYNNSGPPTISTVSCGTGSETVWKQICCVGNFTQSKIIGYNNGSYVTEAAYVSSAGNDSVFGIGRAGTTFGGWNEAYLGNIAQVSIYNRALSIAEIQQNFNATRGRYGI